MQDAEHGDGSLRSTAGNDTGGWEGGPVLDADFRLHEIVAECDK